MKIIEQILTMVINIQFNITALTTDFESCQKNCDDIDGYIPFFSEIGLIHSQLYINGSLAREKFSIFSDKRRVASNDKNLRFFISTNYDFPKQIWKSGFSKIDRNDWVGSNKSDHQFPIEGDGFGCNKHIDINQVDINQVQSGLFKDPEIAI